MVSKEQLARTVEAAAEEERSKLLAGKYRRPYMYPKQEEYIFTDKRYLFCEASTKSGKTVGCIAWLFEQAVINGGPNRNFWWVAPSRLQALDAYERMKRGLPRRLYRKNDTDRKITVVNGAVIWFKTGEEPDLLYGPDVYAVVMDEASRMREEAWVAIQSTTSATQGPVRCIGNVKGRKNWFYRHSRRAQAGEPDMQYGKMTCADAIEAGIMDSLVVEQARANMPEQFFRELYFAEAADDEGNPFGYDAIRACLGPKSTKPPVAWGWDVARTQDWTVGVGLDEDCAVSEFRRWRGVPWLAQAHRVRVLSGSKPALVDSTGVGDPFMEMLWRTPDGQLVMNNFEGIKLSTETKQKVVENLVSAIQSETITYPDGPIAIELDSFEYQYPESQSARARGLVLYAAPEGMYDDCLKPGTLVQTVNGYRPVESVMPGDMVLTHKGRYRPVAINRRKAFIGEMHRVAFRNGLELDLSYNHPLLAASRDYSGDISGPFTKRKWVNPADWKKSYRCVSMIAPLSRNGNSLNEPMFYKHSEAPRRVKEVELDERFAAFLGRFIADGHARKHGYGIELAFHADDTALWGFVDYIRSLGPAVRVEQAVGRCQKMIFSSKFLWHVLRTCYDKDGEKILPPWLFKCGGGGHRLLSEWLEGDGWVRQDTGQSIGATTSRALALGMRDLAWSHGKYATVKRHSRFRYGKRNKDQYWVSIRNDHPFLAASRRLSANEYGSPIRQHRVYEYTGDVYNLQVEEDRSFVAEGTVVHNCVIALALARKKWTEANLGGNLQIYTADSLGLYDEEI